MAYRFKYYFKDGTIEKSNGYGNTPESLYNDFDGLMDWDEFNQLSEQDITTKKVLEMAMKVYKGFLKDFYKIEIIDDETNKIVDSIEEK